MASIGSRGLDKSDRKYFYKLTRSDNNDLILTKVEVTNSQGESVDLQDANKTSADNMHNFRGFELGTTYNNLFSRQQAEQDEFVRTGFVSNDYVSDPDSVDYKDVIDESLGITQYIVRNEDFNVFIDNNGNFIISVNS